MHPHEHEIRILFIVCVFNKQKWEVKEDTFHNQRGLAASCLEEASSAKQRGIVTKVPRRMAPCPPSGMASEGIVANRN